MSSPGRQVGAMCRYSPGASSETFDGQRLEPAPVGARMVPSPKVGSPDAPGVRPSDRARIERSRAPGPGTSGLDAGSGTTAAGEAGGAAATGTTGASRIAVGARRTNHRMRIPYGPLPGPVNRVRPPGRPAPPKRPQIRAKFDTVSPFG